MRALGAWLELLILLFIVLYLLPGLIGWYVGFELEFIKNMFGNGKEFYDAIT